MSSLGDVLEVIFARPDPAVSVHAVVHERQDHEVAQRVIEQAGKDLRDDAFPTLIHYMMAPVLVAETLGRITKRVRRDPPAPGPVPESELTIWLDASGRARLERTWSTPEGTEQLTTVVTTGPAGHDIRLRDVAWPKRKHGPARWPAPTAVDVERLFNHQQLREILSCLVLDAPREDEVAGRQVVVVQAVVRQPPHQFWPHWLPFGAESYELAFDREFGSLLAFRGRAGGAVYEEVAVTEISYGDPIDERLLAAS